MTTTNEPNLERMVRVGDLCNQQEIADEYGCSRSLINNRFMRYPDRIQPVCHIKTMPLFLWPEVDEFMGWYEDGLTGGRRRPDAGEGPSRGGNSVGSGVGGGRTSDSVGGDGADNRPRCSVDGCNNLEFRTYGKCHRHYLGRR